VREALIADDKSYLPLLRDDFKEIGPHGVHLCLIIDILTTDISNFRRSAAGKHPSLRMATIIVVLVVESLESWHDLNIMHAGA
jgi:serine/threonine-protein kinase SRPK3